MDDEAPRPEVEAEPLRPLEFRLSLRSWPKFKETSLCVNEFDIELPPVVLALAELLLQLLEASTRPESLLRLTGLLPMFMWLPVALDPATLLKLELVPIDTIDEGLVLADADETVEIIMVRDWKKPGYISKYMVLIKVKKTRQQQFLLNLNM